MSTTDSFPMYLLYVNGEGSFFSLREAGRVFDNGHVQVSFGELVLFSNFSTRPMTIEDKGMIEEAANDYSESK